MKKFGKSIIIIVVLIGAYYLFTTLFGSLGTSVTFGYKVDTLTLTAPKKISEVIPYSEIDNLELIDMTDPGTPVDGGKFLRSYYGTWEREDIGRYTIFFSKASFTSKATKAIKITKKDGSVTVFNSTDDTETTNMFTMFTQLLESKRSGTESR